LFLHYFTGTNAKLQQAVSSQSLHDQEQSKQHQLLKKEKDELLELAMQRGRLIQARLQYVTFYSLLSAVL